jgi:hypothetical protein
VPTPHFGGPFSISVALAAASSCIRADSAAVGSRRSVLRAREYFELCQKLGRWASLQDHIRNDVAVRSIAGSVVL